jgi:hypothetical protein
MMSVTLRVAALVLAGLAYSASSSAALAAANGPLEGVWKITKVVTTGADAATTSSPQPSVIIFHQGYYAYVSAGNEPRTAAPPAKNPDKLTDADKLAKFAEWEHVTAQGGTFEIKGTTLIRHPSVAKNVSVMTTDGPISQQFKRSGNSLLLISKSAAGPSSETTTTLTRVK